jgi:hypothetical protein
MEEQSEERISSGMAGGLTSVALKPNTANRVSGKSTWPCEKWHNKQLPDAVPFSLEPDCS